MRVITAGLNLQSKSITIAPMSTFRIHGDPKRTRISLNVPGEQSFDIAICPLGTTDPTPYWMDGMIGGSEHHIILHHFGEVFVRDTDNTGDETFNIISDTPIITS